MILIFHQPPRPHNERSFLMQWPAIPQFPTIRKRWKMVEEFLFLVPIDRSFRYVPVNLDNVQLGKVQGHFGKVAKVQPLASSLLRIMINTEILEKISIW